MTGKLKRLESAVFKPEWMTGPIGCTTREKYWICSRSDTGQHKSNSNSSMCCGLGEERTENTMVPVSSLPKMRIIYSQETVRLILSLPKCIEQDSDSQWRRGGSLVLAEHTHRGAGLWLDRGKSHRAAVWGEVLTQEHGTAAWLLWVWRF